MLTMTELKRSIENTLTDAHLREVATLVAEQAHRIGYAEGMEAAVRIQIQVNEMLTKPLSKLP